VLGYCGVEIDPERMGIDYDQLPLMRNGMTAKPDPQALSAILAGNRYTITVDLGTDGTGSAVLYTCDCTEEYVRINMF
jgi:N-acetylglutamate synthase/N-acetylornithine aminotransferase